MASLRNAAPRKTHKERAQPAARAHLGLLEKKSDYKERAENYQSRRKKLTTLAKKAADRNPDEFYFSMTRRVAGKPQRAEATTSHRTLVRLKEQDLRLVSARKVADDRRVDKLRAQLHDTASATEHNEKTYFVRDAADEAAARDSVGGRRNSGRVVNTSGEPDAAVVDKDKASSSSAATTAKDAKLAKKRVRRAYARLDDALEKQQVSSDAYLRLQAEKHAMTAKGRKRKVAPPADDDAGGSGGRKKPAVFKWKKERKK